MGLRSELEKKIPSKISRSQANWSAADFSKVRDEVFERVNSVFCERATEIGGEPEISAADWQRLDAIESRCADAREANAMAHYRAAWNEYEATALAIFKTLTKIKGA